MNRYATFNPVTRKKKFNVQGSTFYVRGSGEESSGFKKKALSLFF